jgi:hypothetical protein
MAEQWSFSNESFLENGQRSVQLMRVKQYGKSNYQITSWTNPKGNKNMQIQKRPIVRGNGSRYFKNKARIAFEQALEMQKGIIISKPEGIREARTQISIHDIVE